MGKHSGRKKMPTQYEKGIAIREWRQDYYVVDFQVNNKRVRKGFTDLEKAKVYCREKRVEITNKGTDALSFTDRMRHDALQAVRLLDGSGVSLLDAVKDYVKRNPKTKGETVEETCTRYLAAMGANGRRQLSIIDKQYKFKALCKDLGTRQTSTLDVTDLRTWVSQFSNGKAAKHITAAKSLLTFFKGELKERRKTDEKPPVTWDVNLVTALFAKAEESQKEIIPAFTVLWFAGLRPNEMLRLMWEQIDLDGKVIRLTGEQTKTRTMRNVTLTDNALKWLQAYRGTGPIISTANRFRTLREELMKACSITEWPVDVPRHTFATMHYNAHHDAAATMAQLGHFGNSQMFVTHYKGVPVTAAEVEAYWKIMPKVAPDKANQPEKPMRNEVADIPQTGNTASKPKNRRLKRQPVPE